MSDFRAHAYRQAAQQSCLLALWLVTTVLATKYTGWWALLPGWVALRCASLWLISLSRLNRLPGAR
jgi:hypothetical protein